MENNRSATFPKNERLSWKRHLDLLFQKGLSFVVYPLRIIYLPVDKGVSEPAVSMVVSVSKKKIKHAVDRNYIKRRIRESYRLQKCDLIHSFSEKNKQLLLAFIYMDKEKSSFKDIERTMTKAMQTIRKKTE